jgi:hypothetical protein
MATKIVVVLALGLAACGGNSIDSNEQARRAYLGLDKSISKSLSLGFAGYNAASSANIPAETAPGDASGTLTITGHVAQGNPGQSSMGLNVAMMMYSDGKFMVDDKTMIQVTYDTGTSAQPSLSLKLNSSAGDSLSGSLSGDYQMSGDLQGTVTLNLQLSGTFSGTAPNVTRTPGSTTVTGTATNTSGGSYAVNVTL